MTDLTDVYWLEQTQGDLPAGNRWLSAEEKSRLAGLRFEKRRAEWALGRWTAKLAVASCLNLPIDVHSLRDIELRTTCSGAPELFILNQRAHVRVSLSHRSGKALCVVGLSEASLGCDLELVEPRDHSFLTDFFTENERQLVERAQPDERPLLTTLLWSAKESALKALHVGLRVSTTSLEVHPADAALCLAERSQSDNHTEWFRLSLRGMGSTFCGWWRYANNMVRTIVFTSRQ